MDLSKIHCLTVKYDRLSGTVACSVTIKTPRSLLLGNEKQSENVCIAIWDTGATGSAITELTAQKLAIAPTGRKKVSGLGGTTEKNTYLVDVQLPNNVTIENLVVTEVDNPIDSNGNKIDSFGMLIGMDIISTGDFCVTNFEGKTIMSFRMPSMIQTDYVEEWKRRMAVQMKNKRR